MLTFLALADTKKPKWIVWENVPGVLSSNGGRDFGTFLSALGNIGYGFAYRVLDAQYFGVAQRRRRVFVVGHLGDWRPAAAVLFESQSLQRDSKQSRAKRQETATDAQGGVGEAGDVSCAGGNVSPCVTSKWMKGYGGPSGSNETGNMVYEQIAQPITMEKIAGPIDASYYKGQGSRQGGEREFVAQPIAVDCFNQTINEKTSQTIGSSASDVNHYGAVLEPTIIDRAAFNQGQNAQYEPRIEAGQTMSSLVAKGPHAVQHTMAIRRLTPKECERLQGFPDDWTRIPYRNKPADQCPDGPRYKACGNSMAVPVMRWIGQRIEYVESLMKDL